MPEEYQSMSTIDLLFGYMTAAGVLLLVITLMMPKPGGHAPEHWWVRLRDWRAKRKAENLRRISLYYRPPGFNGRERFKVKVDDNA